MATQIYNRPTASPTNDMPDAHPSHTGRTVVHLIAFVLVVIGALNWGLIGLFEFNLVAAIFGDGAAARFVYLLVGLAALIVLYTEFALMRPTERMPAHRTT